MTARPGRIIAHLAQTSDEPISPDLIGLVNQNVRPPTPLGHADIYVRVMHIVSDQVNSFGGRFPGEELEHLADLLVDSPVLVGHRKDQLPIARTFHAEPVERNNQRWVKSYFFWLKSSDGAESLKDNIDGGIYKECSIGFTFSFPRCSVCGEDIRRCPHTPLQTYPEANGTPCYFDYCQIEKVLETSLVYRGATPDTSVGNDLMITKDSSSDSLNHSHSFHTLSDLADLPSANSYLITPRYDGIRVTLHRDGIGYRLTRDNGESLVMPKYHAFDLSDVVADSATGLLVGYRGKERCSVADLERFLAGQSTPVTRTALLLYPPHSGERVLAGATHTDDRVRTIRHRFVEKNALVDTIQHLKTKQGVEITCALVNGAVRVFRYLPDAAATQRREYTLHVDSNGAAEFSFGTGVSTTRLALRQFNLNRFMAGCRFIADRITDDSSARVSNGAVVMRGTFAALQSPSDSWRLSLPAQRHRTLIIRPIRHRGEDHYLFYLSRPATSDGEVYRS